jgi:type IV pilus assembly protein PilA
MQERFRRMREERAAGDRGFTLIEMLVVVVIIGVLAGISIPLYLNYRKGAENKSAESDVRGAITAVEQYYTENGNVYPATQIGALSTNMTFAVAGGTTQTATVSAGNTLSYRNNITTYVICGQNNSGLTIFVFNSATGRPVGKSTQATLATCVANGN